MSLETIGKVSKSVNNILGSLQFVSIYMFLYLNKHWKIKMKLVSSLPVTNPLHKSILSIKNLKRRAFF